MLQKYKGIYGYIDKKTNQLVYIGKDSNLHKRNRDKTHNKPSMYNEQQINRVIQNNPNRYKYIELIRTPYEISPKDLNELEKIFIKTQQPKFNFTKGGDGVSYINKEDHYFYRSDVPDGDELEKLNQTYSQKEIAKMYNIHQATIAERLIKHRGIKGPGWSQKRNDVPNGEELYDELQQGFLQKDLAEKYECSEGFIGKRIREYKDKINEEYANPRVENLSSKQLYEEWKNGVSFPKLAEKYNCSRSTIVRRVNEYRKEINESPKQLHIPSDEELYNEWESGLSKYQLAKKYNCSKNTIHAHIKKYMEKNNIPPRFSNIPSSEELYKEWQGGLNQYELAKKYNCSQPLIWKRITKYREEIDEI